MARITDAEVRARARHVVTENERVRAFAAALYAGDVAECGALMAASHESLRTDFEVSTPRLDHLAAELNATAGVFGARLTGAGFGGCVVALTRPQALHVGWRVHAVNGARVVEKAGNCQTSGKTKRLPVLPVRTDSPYYLDAMAVCRLANPQLKRSVRETSRSNQGNRPYRLSRSANRLTTGRRAATMMVVLFTLFAAMCLWELDSCGEPHATGDKLTRLAAGTRA